jgi:hypothetical protein
VRCVEAQLAAVAAEPPPPRRTKGLLVALRG